MATLEDYEKALRNAHNAGDTQSAAILAQAYKQARDAESSKEGTSALSRFGQGLIEPVEGLTQTVMHALPQDMKIPFTDVTPQQVARFGEQKRAEQEARNKAAGIETNIAGGVGNVLSPANLVLAARNPVVAGAIGGAISPTTEVNSEEYWPSKATQATTGAALGGIGGALSNVATGVIKGATPSDYAKQLMKEGVTLTPGQLIGGRANVIESKMESLPLVGDFISKARRKGIEEFNQAAINRALEPVGASTNKIGNEGIKEAGDILSAKYDEILPNLNYAPDVKFSKKLDAIASNLKDTQKADFIELLDKNNVRGNMSGEDFKISSSNIKSLAKDFQTSSDGWQRQLGKALSDAADEMQYSLERANPDFAKNIKNIDRGWASLSRIETAGQKDLAEGVFSPAQFSMALRQSDKSVRNRATARGTALLQDLSKAAQNVLPSKYPDSGTTGRLMMDAALAGSIPYEPHIAMALGAASLPYVNREATQYLMTQRPEVARKVADILRQGSKPIVAANPYLINETGE